MPRRQTYKRIGRSAPGFLRLAHPLLILILLFPFIPREAKAAAASLYLAPASGNYSIGAKFNVSVKVNTGGDPVNAAEGTISYDADLLEVTGISKSGSIFSLWTTEPAASGGRIGFGGGIPHPGYKGTAGQIFTISFKAKKTGSAKVRFASGAVLANDGKGTNILSSMGSGSYTIASQAAAPDKQDTPQATPKKEETAEAEYNKPDIKSETHPDQNRWYNNPKPVFKWNLPEAVTGVSIKFDQNPATDPGQVSDGLFAEKEFEADKDGSWYLHLKFKDAKRWGTVAHYRVMIDTRPPKPFDAEIRYMEVGEWPELLFQTEDVDSGLDKYEIIIGSLEEKSHTVQPETKSFKAENLEVGEHTAVIKAVDKAGNEIYSTVKFSINPIEAPVILSYAGEIRPTDNFYLEGTAAANSLLTIYIEGPDGKISTGSSQADAGGNWFYINKNDLPKGRHTAWATAKNANGIGSLASRKISFLVSLPVFATLGSFVVNYFTVLVSLLFMIILIIIASLYLAGMLRKKLRKEAVEVEDVLAKNMSVLKAGIEEEFDRLDKLAGKAAFKKEKTASRKAIEDKVETAMKSVLKEVKDVEKILE